MNKIYDFFTKRKYCLCALLIGIFIILIPQFVFIKRDWVLLGDSADYWYRGNVIFNNGFDIRSIDGFRGYIFPLYLSLIHALGQRTAYYVFNAVSIPLFFAFILPGLNTEKLPNNIYTAIKILLFILSFSLLFTGLFLYPLSDMFALMNICTATVFMKKSLDCGKFTGYVYIFLSGIFGYLAYNTRTIYLFADTALIILYIILIFKSRGITPVTFISAIKNMAIFSLGTILAASPQILMNYTRSGSLSIKVPTNNLMLFQMYMGIKYQRYDTYIGWKTAGDLLHPNAQVEFLDPTGIKLLNETGLESFESWSDFFRLFAHNPLDIAGIYLRHVLNFIFPCWPRIYVENLNSDKWFWGILGYTVFFIVIFSYLNKCCKGNKIIYYIPMLVPALFIIPGAVEYRFSLPLYITALSVIFFNIDFSKLKGAFAKYKLCTALCYLIFFRAVFSVWSGMLASESVTPLFFN